MRAFITGTLQSLAIVAGFLAFGLAFPAVVWEYVDPSHFCHDEPWSPCPIRTEE